jgi:hypothetical protein
VLFNDLVNCLVYVALVINERVWSIGGMILTGETEVLGEKPITVPLCPPQISYGLTWDRTRTFAVRGLPNTSCCRSYLTENITNTDLFVFSEIFAAYRANLVSRNTYHVTRNT